MDDLIIEDIAFGGKGVARTVGKVLFIPYTIEGEEVEARITREKKKFAEAELISIHNPSPHRVEPVCPYFGKCGGCSYQHIDYAHQLEIKYRQVEQTLKRVGRLQHVPMRPIIPSKTFYGYRNRIRVHVSDGMVGFYAPDSHTLIDIESCAIASPRVNESLGDLRSRMLQDGDYTAAERTGGYFEQTNDAVGGELLTLVRDQVSRGQAHLVDAYCGAGFFAKHLADLFDRVTGIEENVFAVRQAEQSSPGNVHYLAGDVAEYLGEILGAGDPGKRTLLLDPPAAGVSPRVLDLILAFRPSEIVYISCNPATLARDLAVLGRSYALDSVTPLDMFPQTAEIETVAKLT